MKSDRSIDLFCLFFLFIFLIRLIHLCLKFLIGHIGKTIDLCCSLRRHIIDLGFKFHILIDDIKQRTIINTMSMLIRLCICSIGTLDIVMIQFTNISNDCIDSSLLILRNGFVFFNSALHKYLYSRIGSFTKDALTHHDLSFNLRWDINDILSHH